MENKFLDKNWLVVEADESAKNLIGNLYFFSYHNNNCTILLNTKAHHRIHYGRINDENGKLVGITFESERYIIKLLPNKESQPCEVMLRGENGNSLFLRQVPL